MTLIRTLTLSALLAATPAVADDSGLYDTGEDTGAADDTADDTYSSTDDSTSTDDSAASWDGSNDGAADLAGDAGGCGFESKAAGLLLLTGLAGLRRRRHR